MQKHKEALSKALTAHETRFNERIELLRVAHRTEAAAAAAGADTTASADGGAGGGVAPSAARAASTRARIERFVASARLERTPPQFARTARLRELAAPVLAQRSGISTFALVSVLLKTAVTFHATPSHNNLTRSP